MANEEGVVCVCVFATVVYFNATHGKVCFERDQSLSFPQTAVPFAMRKQSWSWRHRASSKLPFEYRALLKQDVPFVPSQVLEGPL